MDSPRAAAVGRESTGNERGQGLQVPTGNYERSRLREVQITGTAEVRCPADRVSVRVSVATSKDSVSVVTDSVTRRLEYILQCLRQHGIKDEDTAVRRFLQRDANLYRMDVEVVVTFVDFVKMEQVCSVLLEKLDKSVCVGTPQFYHSAACLSQLRKRACVSATENAQQKAKELSELLGQSLGPPLLVREEETREWRDEEDGGRGQLAAPLWHLPCMPTITASSRVSVSFSLKDRSRKKIPTHP